MSFPYRFDAYFFDFDGTVGDTDVDIRCSWLKAIAKLELTCENFDSCFRVGPAVQDTAALLFPAFDAEKREIIIKTYKSFYDDADDYQALPYPDIRETMKKLRDVGKKVYIVTNKRVKPLFKLVDKFGLREVCHGIFAPDSFPCSPHVKKDILLATALQISGSHPSRSLMIGDTEIDMEAGKYCSMKTCFAKWGYGISEKVSATCPDYTAESPKDIP